MDERVIADVEQFPEWDGPDTHAVVVTIPDGYRIEKIMQKNIGNVPDPLDLLDRVAIRLRKVK